MGFETLSPQEQLSLEARAACWPARCSVVGIASGITTFVGQAHGAAESSLKGVILQRGLLIALATAVLPLLGWTQLSGLLSLLGGYRVQGQGSWTNIAYLMLEATASLYCQLECSVNARGERGALQCPGLLSIVNLKL